MNIRHVSSLLIIGAMLTGATLAATGCDAGPPLVSASITPDAISPNADGVEDVAVIAYALRRPAEVSIYFIERYDETKTRHYFRDHEDRSALEYSAYFSGVVNGRILPDGDYTCAVEAVDDAGMGAVIELPFAIRGGDPVALDIVDLSVFPLTFSPNRDGVNDRVKISYRLTKDATIIVTVLNRETGERYPVDLDAKAEAGVQQHDWEGGVDLGAPPPPNGFYTVTVEARDLVGQYAVAGVPLTITNGGVPLAEIIHAEFWPESVPLGQKVAVTITVRNTGNVAIRTQGPASGYTYKNNENFNTVGYFESPGCFRVAVDFEGNTISRVYPYRWAVSKRTDLAPGDWDYLQPGEEVTITGYIEFAEPPPQGASDAPYFWVGLEHEHVGHVNDRMYPTQITFGF
ncbi:MAG: hypothetical protein KKA73_21665 [Chloroflexi bacterium]|nr:hypothetical protein [Chloroflexota bacterium]MBU1750302.1 hypothetical protein [Chloroflexota bacterium]